MNKNALTILITVLVILLALFSPMIMGVLAILAWVYLVMKIRKQEVMIFQDQVEPALAERLLKKMKVLVIVAGCAFLVFIVGAFLQRDTHNLTMFDVPLPFIIILVSVWVFIFSTFGSLMILLKGQQKLI
jgi:hypothetical protein